MAEESEEEQEDNLGFWSSWRQLYIFIAVYGVLQIIVLYWFTNVFNRP